MMDETFDPEAPLLPFPWAGLAVFLAKVTSVVWTVLFG